MAKLLRFAFERRRCAHVSDLRSASILTPAAISSNSASTRGSDVTPLAWYWYRIRLASASLPWAWSQRGDSGMNGRAAITKMEGIPCIKDGMRHDHELSMWPVPKVVHAAMIDPTYQRRLNYNMLARALGAERYKIIVLTEAPILPRIRGCANSFSRLGPAQSVKLIPTPMSNRPTMNTADP